MSVPIPFDNTYSSLPDRFFARLRPSPVEHPTLVRVNEALAEVLGIAPSVFEGDAGAAWVGGNSVPDGAEPIATAYAGHQFGQFNAGLGDGRALLLGEVVGTDGVRYDLQLKGSGPTPFSRGGDGRAPLGPVLREYVVSEAMAALDIPTTRSLAAATTGEAVYRDTALPGAILLRVARSHIRVGTFEFFAARRDREALRLLLDHVLERHYPDCHDSESPALAVLERVAERQAELVAKWQLVGFIHGVMNTDNMLVCGDTVDYGPCAFLDAYEPGKVFSSIDHRGRYAFDSQPAVARWNVAMFARTLIELFGDDEAGIDRALAHAQRILDAFPETHRAAHRRGLGRKLGLSTIERDDEALGQELLSHMHRVGADFTLTFRWLTERLSPPEHERDSVESLGGGPIPVDWLERWRTRVERDPRPPEERAADTVRENPAIIPRNHLVEAAVRAAEDEGDFAPFHDLVDATARPYHYDASRAAFARAPRPEERVRRTFCGT